MNVDPMKAVIGVLMLFLVSVTVVSALLAVVHCQSTARAFYHILGVLMAGACLVGVVAVAAMGWQPDASLVACAALLGAAEACMPSMRS